jgi:hypothetical protein
VRAPETLIVGGTLGQVRGASREVDARQRPVAEHVTHALAELVAKSSDGVGGRATVAAGIAAVFHQRDTGGLRPQRAIAGAHGSVEMRGARLL